MREKISLEGFSTRVMLQCTQKEKMMLDLLVIKLKKSASRIVIEAFVNTYMDVLPIALRSQIESEQDYRALIGLRKTMTNKMHLLHLPANCRRRMVALAGESYRNTGNVDISILDEVYREHLEQLAFYPKGIKDRVLKQMETLKIFLDDRYMIEYLRKSSFLGARLENRN